MNHNLTEEEWEKLEKVLVGITDLLLEVTEHIVDFEERLSNLEAR